MNYQSSSFGGDWDWNAKLLEGQKAKISLKIFVLSIDLRVVQKSEQAKLYL